MTLEAIASGIGPTHLVQRLSFLDLPKVKTINDQFFYNMRLIFEPILKKVETKVMEEALVEEVKLTLGKKEKTLKCGNKVTYRLYYRIFWYRRE